MERMKRIRRGGVDGMYVSAEMCMLPTTIQSSVSSLSVDDKKYFFGLVHRWRG
jgi:hypothetical protein